ncbi:phage tail family protein [Lactococcus lactis]|uniref:distal tail protein Dit n=1 Tax=Lactococcus lactis TaxID=1358 RepID=UPI0010BE338D|nr:distal tail protein Dit [Lactococcus lactis]MDS1012632.1 phage tail family protein [Lactococcus lactis]MDS1014360.1 phage tail family protein [Lactococcus lactis]TKD79352.1 phage tail protein [Lactococcus lactis]UXV69280.1 phage tail family protein [Lactococcus lactis subsp. lactis]
MTLTVNFAGNELTKHMRIIDVKRNLGAGIDIVSQKRAGNGEDFISSRKDSSKIVVDFRTFDDITAARRLLAALTSSETLAELSFSDEPNVRYRAIREGEITLTENKSKLFSDGTITFKIPSGAAESVTQNVLNATNSGGENGTITPNTTDGSIEIKVNNKGTLPTFPKIKLTNVSENGYFGIVGVKGLIGLGNINEADGVTNPMSEQLYDSASDTSFSDFKDVAPGTPNPQNNWLATNGKLEFQTDGLRLKDQGTVDSRQGVAGGMKVMTLPADSNGHVGAVNFYSYFNIFAWAGAFGQTGLLQVLFTDANNKLVAGYGVSKGDMVDNKASMKCWVGGNSPREYASNDFISNNGEGNGAGSMNNTSFNERTGHSDFVKTGSQLEFYWKGSRIKAIIPELETVEIAKVYIYIGQYVQSNKFMTNLSLRNISYRKDKVSVWSNVPNRYAAGSVVEIDMENDKIFTNGVATNKDFVNGGKFFSIPPGESTIIINQSAFNHTPPQVELTWKENYL